MKDWTELKQHISKVSYDHFSFDFWRTIAFSNPKFKKYRTELIISLSRNNCSELDVEEAFRYVGISYNKRMEEEGFFLQPHDLYSEVFTRLCMPDVDAKNASERVDELFLKYPPIVSSGFEFFFQFLKNNGNSNHTNSITSNTAFISGDVIKLYLSTKHPELDFAFMLFSDSELIAKPNKEIFELMKLKARKLRSAYENEMDFIHIGDNHRTDVEGATKAGVKGFLISDYSNYEDN